MAARRRIWNCNLDGGCSAFGAVERVEKRLRRGREAPSVRFFLCFATKAPLRVERRGAFARFYLRFATKAPLRVERRGACGAVEKRLRRGSFSASLRKRPFGSSGEAPVARLRGTFGAVERVLSPLRYESAPTGRAEKRLRRG